MSYDCPVSFTYEYLEKFLRYIKERHPVVNLGEGINDKGIILRHDVDIDINSAYRMSQIEKRVGLTSSFCILLTGHLYNPLCSPNRKIIADMTNDGFEIGLHFDPTIYGDIDEKEMLDKVNLECRLLEGITGRKVMSISLHNPSLHGQYPIFKGYANAYSRELFCDEQYLSDSCMSFRGKNPFKFIDELRKYPAQVLLHPEHWTPEGTDYIGILSEYNRNLINYIDDTLRANSTYKECIKNDRLLDVIYRPKKYQHNGRVNLSGSQE